MYQINKSVAAYFCMLYIILINPMLRSQTLPYKIVDTGQKEFFNNFHNISRPSKDQPFFGQDAEFTGMAPVYKDNADGTITDLVTGLMWQQSDSKKAMSWKDALSFAQQKNEENYLGCSDWRLPNAKELQSIVDYGRSPQETESAAIDPLFEVSQIKDEGGNNDFSFYWSSTTHKNIRDGHSAVYVAFGKALAYFKPPFSKGKGVRTFMVQVRNAVILKQVILKIILRDMDRREM